MDRREGIKQLMLLLGVSAAMPLQALDFGKMISAATSLGKAATLSDADLQAYYSQLNKEYDKQKMLHPVVANMARG